MLVLLRMNRTFIIHMRSTFPHTAVPAVQQCRVTDAAASHHRKAATTGGDAEAEGPVDTVPIVKVESDSE